MNKIYLFIFLVSVFSCAPVMKENITKKYELLPVDSKIAILELKHKVPNNVEQLGTLSMSDSGFTTDCDYKSNIFKARKRAREIGANVIKITEEKSPDIISSCYRMKFIFYRYNGEVDQLVQLQLQ